jgi:hypothetical protein
MLKWTWVFNSLWKLMQDIAPYIFKLTNFQIFKLI